MPSLKPQRTISYDYNQNKELIFFIFGSIFTIITIALVIAITDHNFQVLLGGV